MVHEQLPELRDSLPHLRLGPAPTPVRRLADDLWVKDEAPFGGNKARKLEWLLPQAERRGVRTIVSTGALGTNWGLVLANHARERGIRTELALVDQPLTEHVRVRLAELERVATVHRTRDVKRTALAVPAILARAAARDRRPPLLLPTGGSSPLGAVGYVEAALELARQVQAGELPEPTRVVVAVGSGGTAAGLALGLRLAGLRTRVLGVIVADQLPLHSKALARLARRTAALLRKRGAYHPLPWLAAGDIDTTRAYLGAGYGHPTPESERALAESGLGLDPVYSAKAFAALADRGPGPTVFVQTATGAPTGPSTLSV